MSDGQIVKYMFWFQTPLYYFVKKLYALFVVTLIYFTPVSLLYNQSVIILSLDRIRTKDLPSDDIPISHRAKTMDLKG